MMDGASVHANLKAKGENMKQFVTALIFLMTVVLPAYAQTPISECAQTLRYDTKSLDQNLLATLTAVSSMSESTFDSAKTDAAASGVTAYGIFDGSYSEAQQKARDYKQSFSIDQLTVWSSKFLSHTLSPEGARAYAECVRATSGAPVSAWIENTQSRNPINLKIKLGDAWTAAEISVDGASPNTAPTRLEGGGSEQTLRFEHNPSQSFSVTVTAKNPITSQTRSITVEQAPYRVVKLRAEHTTDEGWVSCAAGCGGNTAGCSTVEPYTFVAPATWSYDEDTLAVDYRRARVRGGPGVKFNNVFPEKVPTKSGGKLTRLTVTPRQCEGNSPHTQGTSTFPYTLRRSRQVAYQQ
jgi:hypothetical protein